MDRGFTLIEILVALAIILIIGAIGVSSFISSRREAGLSGLADGISFALEQARSTAMSGLNGTGAGVSFATSSYSYFDGTTFDPSDPSDKTYQADGGYQISTSLTGDTATVSFSRLTGEPTATGTIRITDQQDSASSTITIGSQGDITVTKP